MINSRLPAAIWDSVLPVCNNRGFAIGTGVVVAPRLVLTALHVVDRELAPRITDLLPIAAIISLRPWQVGRARHLARSSYQRSHTLTGHKVGAVDLALLAVPDLEAPALPSRRTPVGTGELVTIPGYPLGQRTASHGPITSTDAADFVAHVSLGPGSSGAPVIDDHGQLAGLVTMDHPTAGAIAIGPTLLTAFLEHAIKRLKPHDTNPRHCIEPCR